MNCESYNFFITHQPLEKFDDGVYVGRVIVNGKEKVVAVVQYPARKLGQPLGGSYEYPA
jgi:hypothetical protein